MFQTYDHEKNWKWLSFINNKYHRIFMLTHLFLSFIPFIFISPHSTCSNFLVLLISISNWRICQFYLAIEPKNGEVHVYIQSVLALSIRVHSNNNVKPQIPLLPLGRLNVCTKSNWPKSKYPNPIYIGFNLFLQNRFIKWIISIFVNSNNFWWVKLIFDTTLNLFLYRD